MQIGKLQTMKNPRKQMTWFLPEKNGKGEKGNQRKR